MENEFDGIIEEVCLDFIANIYVLYKWFNR